MRQQYFIKATLEGGIAGYDHVTKYCMGENKHPSPDLSDVTCGHGIHLARTIVEAKFCVESAKEFYLAKAGRILGQDKTKVRTDIYYQLWRIPQFFIDDYDAKLGLLITNYYAKVGLLNNDYHAKLGRLDTDYDAKFGLLNTDYRAELGRLDTDYDAKLGLLVTDYHAKAKWLDRLTMRRILRQYHKEGL